MPSEHIENVFVDSGIFDRPTPVCDPISFRPIDGGVNNLLSVADYRDVWIVRHHYDLAALLYCPDDRNQQMIDGLVVEVFFRLINNDRASLLSTSK